MSKWIETDGGWIEVSDAGHVSGAPIDPPGYQPSGTAGLLDNDPRRLAKKTTDEDLADWEIPIGAQR